MKAFFSGLWKTIALLALGALSGILVVLKLGIKPSVITINAENFIAEQTQRIGKLKQRGQGNQQEAVQLPLTLSRKEKRLVRRASRREQRLNRATAQEESDQKNF